MSCMSCTSIAKPRLARQNEAWVAALVESDWRSRTRTGELEGRDCKFSKRTQLNRVKSESCHFTLRAQTTHSWQKRCLGPASCGVFSARRCQFGLALEASRCKHF